MTETDTKLEQFEQRKQELTETFLADPKELAGAVAALIASNETNAMNWGKE